MEGERKSKEKVECYLCGKMCAPKMLKIHVRYHTNLELFDCDLCNARFSTKTILKTHKKTHEDWVDCERCGKQHRTKQCPREKTRSHICELCKKAFLSKPDLIRHTRTHTKEKPFGCEYCEKSFAQKSVRDTHSRKYHSSLSTFKGIPYVPHEKTRDHICEICKKAFLSNHDLTRHLRSHTNEKPFGCEYCERRFSQKSNRDNHSKQHQEIKKPRVKKEPVFREKKFVCTICFKAFAFKENLTRHMHIHSEKKPYVCHICQKGFILRYQMKAHIETHSDQKNYKCDQCPKQFKGKIRLNIHKKKQHKQNPKCNSTCSMCNKVYNSEYLPRHISRIHSKFRPYICDICSKKYSRLTELKKHYISHVKHNIKKKQQSKKLETNIGDNKELTVSLGNELNTNEYETIHQNNNIDCNSKEIMKVADSNQSHTGKTVILKSYSFNISNKIYDKQNLQKTYFISFPNPNILNAIKSAETVTSGKLSVDSCDDKLSCKNLTKIDLHMQTMNCNSSEKDFINPKNEKNHSSVLKNSQSMDEKSLSKDEEKDQRDNTLNNLFQSENIYSAQSMTDSSISKLSEKEPYLCHVCRIAFTSELLLEIHHTNFMVKNSQCCYCSQTFDTITRLVKHHSTHDYISTVSTSAVNIKPGPKIEIPSSLQCVNSLA